MARTEILPGPIDSETRAQLARFLRPLLDAASDWSGLDRALALRGYRLTFRAGRLCVVEVMSDRPICTGSDVGRPLRQMADRLGRPRLRSARDGRSAELA